jgi:hypothetical protein
MMLSIQENTICFIDDVEIFITGDKRCHIYFKVWQDNTACFLQKETGETPWTLHGKLLARAF